MSTEPKGSLKSRILKAGGWHILQIMLGNGMRLTSNLVMTRLLVPEAFGLMSFVMTIVTAFALLSDIGIHRSIIKDPDGDTERYLRAAWVVQIWRGLAVSAGVLLIAILLGLFAPSLSATGTVYGHPLLPYMLAVIAVLPLLDSLKSTNWYLSERIFHNGRLTGINLASQFLAILTQITIATAWPSPWSLIIGMILGQILRTVASHMVLTGPHMLWRPNAEISSRIWSFGKYLMASSGLTFVALNADKLILASIFDSSGFGLYAIAMIWLGAGVTIIGKLTDQVGFSALGEIIRTRPREAQRLFKRFQRALDVICITAFLMFYFLAEPFISLIYTKDYERAGHYLTILSLSFLAVRFNAMGMFVLNNGNSHSMMIASAIRATAIVIFLPLGYWTLGLSGALLATALNQLSSAPYTIWKISPLLGRDYAWRQALWVLAILITALTVFLTY